MTNQDSQYPLVDLCNIKGEYCPRRLMHQIYYKKTEEIMKDIHISQFEYKYEGVSSLYGYNKNSCSLERFYIQYVNEEMNDLENIYDICNIYCGDHNDVKSCVEHYFIFNNEVEI